VLGRAWCLSRRRFRPRPHTAHRRAWCCYRKEGQEREKKKKKKKKKQQKKKKKVGVKKGKR
jgi:hypothetical protein